MLKVSLSAIVFLVITCSEKSGPIRVARIPSMSSATTTSRRTSGHVVLMKLDPKTSMSFSARDRTDDHFFHGFGILKRAVTKDLKDIATVEELLSRITDTEWRRDVVRDADYGIRISTSKNNDDLLVCLSCTPAILVRPTEAVETKLSQSEVDSFRAILISGLGRENYVAPTQR
jgi:hypothetical protein